MKNRMRLIGMVLSVATLAAALGVSAGSTSELSEGFSANSLKKSSVSLGAVNGTENKYDLKSVNEFQKKMQSAETEIETEEIEAPEEVAETEEAVIETEAAVETEAPETEVAETEAAETEAVTETEVASEDAALTEAEVEQEETEAAETEEVEAESELASEEAEAVTEASEPEEVVEEATNPYELAARYDELITEFRTEYTYDELLSYDVCFVDLDQDDMEEMIVREAYAKDDFTTNGAFSVYKYYPEDETMGLIGTMEVPTFDLYLSEKEHALAQIWEIQPTFLYYYNMVDGVLENGVTMSYGNYEGADGAGKRVIERSEEVLNGTFEQTLFSATPEDASWEDADMIWNTYVSELQQLEFSPLLVFLNTIALGTAPVA